MMKTNDMLREEIMAVDAQLVAIINAADGATYNKLKAARDDLVRIWLPLPALATSAAPGRSGKLADERAATQPAGADVMQFADAVIDVAFDGGCLDGGDIQEWAEAHGLIKLTRVTESCGDDCKCVDVGSFPLDCYRKTYLLAAPISEATAPSLERQLAASRRLCAEQYNKILELMAAVDVTTVLLKAAERVQAAAYNFNASKFALGSAEHHAAAHESQAAQDNLIRAAIAGNYATAPEADSSSGSINSTAPTEALAYVSKVVGDGLIAAMADSSSAAPSEGTVAIAAKRLLACVNERKDAEIGFTTAAGYTEYDRARSQLQKALATPSPTRESLSDAMERHYPISGNSENGRRGAFGDGWKAALASYRATAKLSAGREEFERLAESLGIYTCHFERVTAAKVARHAADGVVMVEGDYVSDNLRNCWKLWTALATPRQTEDGGLMAATGEVLWRYQNRCADGWFTQYEADEPTPSSDTRNIVKFVLAPKETAAQGGVPEVVSAAIDVLLAIEGSGVATKRCAKLRKAIEAYEAAAPTGESK